MEPQEIIARLRALRYSPVRDKTLGLDYIARRAGCSRQSLYNIAESGRISPYLASALAPVLQHVQSRKAQNTPAAIAIRALFSPADLAKLPRR